MVAGEQRVLDLGDDGLVEADDARQQRLAAVPVWRAGCGASPRAPAGRRYRRPAALRGCAAGPLHSSRRETLGRSIGGAYRVSNRGLGCARAHAAVSGGRMDMVVNCAVYEDGCRVRDIPIEDISEVLKLPGSFVWVGLYEPDEPLLRKIQEEFGLHDLAVEDALAAHQRPKLEEYGDCLFVVLRTARIDDHGHIVLGETHIFMGPRYVVSVRHGASLSYSEVRGALRDHAAPAEEGAGLRPLRADGLRRRPLLPHRRRARGSSQHHRGGDLFGPARPRRHRTDLRPQTRSAGRQARRVAADRHLQPADALRPRHRPRGYPPLLPRRLRPRPSASTRRSTPSANW